LGTERLEGGTPRSSYAQLAADHGLVPQVGRPPFRTYIRDLWASRHFIWALSTTRTYARNENTYLGQVWAILTPLLYAAVYYVIFGQLLGTSKDIENFTAFLIIGIFVFQLCSGSLSRGGSAIIGNNSMIRSLRFPRAALPISVVVTEFLTLLPAIAVMLVIVTLTGEPPTWSWLLIAPMFLLIATFNVGVAMFVARIVAHSRDVKNLIPFTVQVLRYTSGVFFSIALLVPAEPAATLLHYQPYALSLELIRGPLLEQFTVSWLEVGVMGGWTLLACVGGLVYFWRGEGKYGID